MPASTRQQILSKSEFLVRTRGYAAFSYADLAKDMGITKASVHYHFPAKEDLLHAILGGCIENGREVLGRICHDNPRIPDCLRAYARIYLAGVEEGVLPVCAALAAERSALPISVYPLLTDFFQLQLEWIADTLARGVADGALVLNDTPEVYAISLFSALEGGTLVGWGMDRSSMVLTAFETILSGIEAPASAG